MSNPFQFGCSCGINTCLVCGKFEKPVHPDQGSCNPRRVKIDCEAPTIPANQCNDDQVTAIRNPLSPSGFSILARLFDQNCDLITDGNGDAIFTVSN